jgi:hypothetical protein
LCIGCAVFRQSTYLEVTCGRRINRPVIAFLNSKSQWHGLATAAAP